MARDGVALQLEANNTAAHALGLLPGECLPADELRFVELDKHAQAGFQRRDVGAQLVAVERQTDLETQRVAASQTARLNSTVHQLIPHALSELMAAVDLKAILARIARAAHDDILVVSAQSHEIIERNVAHRQTENPLDGLLGTWTLDGDFAVVGALVLDLDIESLGVAHDPFDVLVDIGGVYHKEELIVAHLIYKQVVDRAAVLVAHHAVENLAGRRAGYIVYKYVVHEPFGIGALDAHLAHMADIENAYSLAHGIVFLGNAAILNRHVIAGKRRHLRTKTHVTVMEAGNLDFFSHGVVLIRFRLRPVGLFGNQNYKTDFCFPNKSRIFFGV